MAGKMLTPFLFVSTFLYIAPLIIGQAVTNKQEDACNVANAELQKCCIGFPTILKNTSFSNCASELFPAIAKRMGQKKKKTVGKSKRDVSKTKQGKVRKGVRRGSRPLCMMECVLREQNLLHTATGYPNFVAVEQAFFDVFKDNSTMSTAWTPVISKAIKTCSEKFSQQLSVLNSIETSDNGKKRCKPHNALVMTCIRKQLIETCPSITPGTECARKVNKWSKCNEFEVKAGYKNKLDKKRKQAAALAAGAQGQTKGQTQGQGKGVLAKQQFNGQKPQANGQKQQVNNVKPTQQGKPQTLVKGKQQGKLPAKAAQKATNQQKTSERKTG